MNKVKLNFLDTMFESITIDLSQVPNVGDFININSRKFEVVSKTFEIDNNQLIEIRLDLATI